MTTRFILLTAAANYECDSCGWDIQQGESFMCIWQGNDHYECICLRCNEIREDKIAVEGEIHEPDGDHGHDEGRRAVDAGPNPAGRG